MKVAYFCSCGVTEFGAMDYFLKKFNENCSFNRCLPTRAKYRKEGQPKEEGLTGSSLIKETLRRLHAKSAQFLSYDAILIEDDLDYRFSDKTEREVLEYLQDITASINEILGEPRPVVFLYASPEIETWFLADWNNTFSQAYRNHIREAGKNDFFCHRLKKYIDDEILGDSKEEIEEFRKKRSDGTGYVKLSDELVNAVNTVKVQINGDPDASDEMKAAICENKTIKYSKSLHGVEMLRRADPQQIAKVCRKYFAPAFSKISTLSTPATK